MPTDIDTIEIHVTSRQALNERLDAAVKELQGVAALARTHGIIVTRHEPGTYTAALSDRVPYGITREQVG
ncbi:hypothetical protein [Pseudarthrobacter raffinosi]|uniref:hypothetical protein n=1 Tax=Pseudarthrobacter raffinosi TaxID=2953651 RepID=UPI00208F67DC|nr:hypothetical protein [Pseudarthrobacter sp. MDT3-9]MCO4253256.1 hypothetical protein [Pseudarthrobacter sp. MDT3-9]